MTATLSTICRHPIKAHGREEIASALLVAGECLSGDRRWAVAHEAAKLVPGWNPCTNFTRGAKAPALMAISSVLTGDRVTLSHPDRPDLAFEPDDPADLPSFLAWVAPLVPPDRARPVRIVSGGRGMTDTDLPALSVMSLASVADLSERLGQPLDPHRFRANLWLGGTGAFEEFGWVGRTLRIGDARLEVRERITRCRATMANPATGRIDADTLGTLQEAYGHRDFGVYAVVTQGGEIARGDVVTVE